MNAALGRNVWLVEPPYELVRIPDGPSPGMGCAIACDLRGRVAALIETAALQRRFPWCTTIVVIRADPPDANLFEALLHLTGAPIYCEPIGAADLASTARRVMASRPYPGADWFAEFASARLHAPASAIWLRAAVEARVTTCAISYRTLCRKLSRLSSLTIEDWRAIHRLSAVAVAHRQSVEAAARFLEIDTRTLRSYTGRFLGMQAREFLPRLGCEWVVSESLRRTLRLDLTDELCGIAREHDGVAITHDNAPAGRLARRSRYRIG